LSKKINLLNGGYALVDDADFNELSKYKWRDQGNGYVQTSYYINRKRIREYMHRKITGAKTSEVVDHINHNKADNRRSNLRVCTSQLNAANTRIRKDNASGYKGVYLDKKRYKWIANIYVNKKCKYLGSFDSPHDAARIYNFWAVDIYGEYAYLNNIEEAV
jgi:hypothetical protein